MSDTIRPKHYKGRNGVELIDLIEDLPFNRGNVIKYVYRAGRKDDELRDLEKARWYIEREIGRVMSGRSAQ